MNEGWDSGEEDTGYSAPIKNQTYSRGGGRGGDYNNASRGGRGGDYNNTSRGGRSDSYNQGGQSNDYNRGGRNDDSYSQPRGRGGRGRGRGRDDDRGSDRTVGNWRENGSSAPSGLVIKVSTSNLGKVIGRGGVKIREIQESTGATVKVGQASAEDFGQLTEITLLGSQEAQQKAKKIIEDIENPPPVVYDEPDEAPVVIDWAAVNKAYDEGQKQKWANLPPMIKKFYIEHPEVSNMSPEEVVRFRLISNNISVSYVFGDGTEPVPNPAKTFEHCFEPFPEILSEIYKQGFEKPSPIQCQAWPVLLGGHDLIGIAQTGTGKTLAFLLPALIHIDRQPIPRSERGGANVLVMAPTRELAIQIEKEVSKYNYKNMKSVCIYGGGDRREQILAVGKGVEIIIATPGRLNDLVQAGIIDVTSVTYLVLDEADRMLDLGFEPQIRKTLLDVRPDRQTVMTSATWPEGVRRLAQSYMVNPIQVFIGSLDLAAVHSVTQRIEFIDEESKNERMMDFFAEMSPKDKVIVFVGKKMKADDISAELCLAGVDAQSIHGGREQVDREQALEDLKSGDVRILIATDVASRGIDIEDVTHIFNYDFPRNIEEYVHRVGRTGRAGKRGEAISLFTRSDWGSAKELIPILEEANQEVPEELRNMAERYDAWRERKDQEKERERIDGGGRGGGGGCYNCGGSGHMSRECPQPRGGGRGGGGGGGGGGCYNCGGSGHMSRECPEPRKGGGGGRGGGRGGGGFGGGGGGRNKW